MNRVLLLAAFAALSLPLTTALPPVHADDDSISYDNTNYPSAPNSDDTAYPYHGESGYSVSGLIRRVDAAHDRLVVYGDDNRRYNVDDYNADILIRGADRAGETADLSRGMRVAHHRHTAGRVLPGGGPRPRPHPDNGSGSASARGLRLACAGDAGRSAHGHRSVAGRHPACPEFRRHAYYPRRPGDAGGPGHGPADSARRGRPATHRRHARHRTSSCVRPTVRGRPPTWCAECAST